ncbi:MAG: ABC transporter permease [Acidobacteria bacterium]|nr:ABC transporter permease [Acidobacteriota bacterium]
MARQDLVDRGATPDNAAAAARREFGNVTLVEHVTRDQWRSRWLDEFGQDLRFAIRTLRKSPGFTAIAILTLALGIGANTALFSVVNGVLLNPLPYPQPEQLVTVCNGTDTSLETWLSYPDAVDLMRDNHSFSSLAAYESLISANLLGQGEPERVSVTEVSSTFFRTLGIAPVLGRDLSPAEDQLNGPPAVILSGGFWKTKFAGSPNIVGKAINLDGTDYTVVGVLPQGFYFCCENIAFRLSDVYTPIGADKNPWMQDRKFHPGVYAVGRLKPNITLIQAREDMNRMARNLAVAYPDTDKGSGIHVTPLKQEMVQNIRPFLLVLLAAVGFVLLIACVNVANLLLARSTGRAREFAIRAALGANQVRVIRQLLTENVLLATAGGGLGLLLSAWGTRAALAVLPNTLPRAGNVRIDPRVLLFTLIVSLFAGLVFGLAPALKTAHSIVQEVLKEGGRGGSGARYRTQAIFVIAEMALTMVLLICAGLSLRTLVGLWSTNPGFDPHNVLSFNVGLPPSVADGDATQVRANLRQLTEKIAAVPGVESVSLMNAAFPMGERYGLDFWVEGQPKPTANALSNTVWYLVGPDYLQVAKIPLLRGRFLTAHDDANASGVCVIDEDFARMHFGSDDPIGKHLNFDLAYKQLEIVGVVGHVKQFGLDEDSAHSRTQAQLYASALQLPDDLTKAWVPLTGYMVRTHTPSNTFAASISDAIRKFNSKAVLFRAVTMDDVIARSLASRRFVMILLAVFAALALVLSSIGIYGVISYVVGQRTHEIGLRMALGARRGDVLRLVLANGVKMALTGIAVGIAAAIALTRLFETLIYGISATDPLTFSGVACILLLVAAAACLVPALRATRVDPIVALRHD